MYFTSFMLFVFVLFLSRNPIQDAVCHFRALKSPLDYIRSQTRRDTASFTKAHQKGMPP